MRGFRRLLYSKLTIRSVLNVARGFCIPVNQYTLTNQVFKAKSNYFNTLHYSTQTDVFTCWNCGISRKAVADLTCRKCNVIQHPPIDSNYFKVFNLEENFNIDQRQLTTKYRQLQGILHPDKFSNKSDKEKSISNDYSALVNKAYSTLQAPLKRGIYMLNLKGENVEEDQKVTDHAFLVEIMELNEEMEAAKGPDSLKKLNEKNMRMLNEIAKDISTHLMENNLEKAKDSIIRMKYYNSLSLRINELLRERGIVD